MILFKPALLACLTIVESAAVQTFHSRQPLRQHSLPHQANDSLAAIFGSNGTVTIKGIITAPGVVVLDYGVNVEGYPTFQVLSTTGDTSGVEITYSESKAVLENFYMVSAWPQELEAYAEPYHRATDHSL
jgi:hypothetical protein